MVYKSGQIVHFALQSETLQSPTPLYKYPALFEEIPKSKMFTQTLPTPPNPAAAAARHRDHILHIQRVWRRKFRHNQTHQLVASFFEHGPTIERVKGMRFVLLASCSVTLSECNPSVFAFNLPMNRMRSRCV
jgi:hypothetical protein